MSKGLCEVPTHRKRHQMNNGIPMERTPFTVSDWEGLTKWKGEIGDGVQDFLGKRCRPECSFSRNAGEWAE